MGLRRFARKLLAVIKPRRSHPAILMYHRVASLQKDPWHLAIDPELFEMQMAYLRSHRTPMAMDEMVERLRTNTLPADAIGVTFDDGYLDNLVNAKPALVKHGVPATVFVATGFTGSGTPFWWDELAGMILEPSNPFELKLPFRKETLTLAWGQLEPADDDPSWRGWDTPQTARQHSYVDLWSRLQSADEIERAEVFRVLREHLKAPADPLGIPMTAVQLEELVTGSLVSVGGHTVTHRALTDLDRTTSRLEIREGGEQCRALVGQPINGFAYPYGNFDPEVRDDVAQSNFHWACTTEPQFLDEGNPNIYTLPRIAAINLPMRIFIESISA